MERNIFNANVETKLGYIVYTPEDLKPGLPLIVFLHGAGERGTDLDLVNKNALPNYLNAGSLKIPAVVLCPQCPSGLVWNNNVVALKQLIDKIAAQYEVDTNRISITGISMGGFGTWEMGITYPDYFCCIAPVCGGGLSWRCGALKEMPIWAFHGDADTVVPPKNSLEMVDAVNSNGGNAKLTIFHGVGHNSWDPAYLDTKLVEWLLSQSK